MANVTFVNGVGRDAYLHMRIGPVDVDPDNRATSNTVIKVDDAPVDVNVGDGDVWYCFGNKQINDSENPELCNLAGGESVTLKSDLRCYVDN